MLVCSWGMVELRILVVDDSPAMRRSIRFALRQVEGLECVEAEDGLKGLKRFTEERFDLVLTDINMPQMDGLKLLHHIRQDEARRALPVIIITTEAGEEDRSRAMRLGANAYLVKPVQSAEVLKTVCELLNLR